MSAFYISRVKIEFWKARQSDFAMLSNIPIINLFSFSSSEIQYIGYIIPGLIASWMDKQGVLRTISVVLIVSSIVNLFLMLVYYINNSSIPNV